MFASFCSQRSPVLTEEPLNLDQKGFCSQTRVVYGSHQDLYRNICVLKPLDKSKYTTYLVNSRVTKLDYIMKIFPQGNTRSNLFFQNEIRLSGLKHPNIVKILYFEHERQVVVNKKLTNVSYIIKEHSKHGDFSDFLRNFQSNLDEKLVRTYFRQLIDGLEYLHNNGVAHMDLKLANLLIGNNYALQIANFEQAHYKEDAMIISNGTKYFRAPEVRTGRCTDAKLADIYSVGIILFILLSRGRLPVLENDLVDGVNLENLLYNNTSEFWTYHSKDNSENKAIFDQDFKDLFVAMTKLNPEERASIETIKTSNWYNGSFYSDLELKEKMTQICKP